jgi:pimeloyl-ACP methyl ester carboxylesterase
MGGPGEDALGAAAFYAEQFATLRANRDLLLIDQRGSGHSGALNCGLYDPAQPAASLRDEFPPEAVQRCENELQARADLTQYGYSRFAQDLERVRQALGYGKLNLFAGSYGTRAAVVYLRAYPASVRTAYLGSVVTIDIPSPLPMPKTSQQAFEALFSACAGDTDCRGAFPNLKAEFIALEQRLATGVEVAIPGTVTSAPLSAGRVAEWFRSLLYRPKSAAQLPWLIHQAYLGNWSPTVESLA